MSLTQPRTAGGRAGIDASFRALLREYAAAFRDVPETLRARAELAPGDPDAVRTAEERGARAVLRLAHAANALATEAAYRQVTEESAQRALVEDAPDVKSLDPAAAFRAASWRPGSFPAAAWLAAADAGSAAASWVAGVAALLSDDPAQSARAIPTLEAAAEGGWHPAAAVLARYVPPDRAVRLLLRAAEAGDPDACAAVVYATVGGAPTGLRPGDLVPMLRRAAEAGDSDAQLDLGRMHADGFAEFPADFAAARSWMERAAAQHRDAARTWLLEYGALSPEQYANVRWLEAFTPAELPPPPPPTKAAIAAAVVVAGLLVAATASGSSVALFLLASFSAIVMHEGGHYVAARLAGIPIVQFSVGVGPLVRWFQIRGRRLPMNVEFRVLPLMGHVRAYVAPLGVWDHWEAVERSRREGAVPPAVPAFDRSEPPEPVFLHAPARRRLAFLSGGLLVNLVCAILFLGIYETCSEEARLVTSPVAGPVTPGSVAEAAGLREGDRFATVAGEPVTGFFDVRRKLAPLDRGHDDDTATPGRTVQLEVVRGGSRMPLVWTVPSPPPKAGDADAWGLLPPETWTVARTKPGRTSELAPGDRILQFRVGATTIRAEDPGAHAALRDAVAREKVELDVRRGPRVIPRTIDTAARDPKSPRTLPFELERAREQGPASGPGEIVGDVFRMGWRAVLGLPGAMLEALTRTPTDAEQRGLLQAVKSDPWEAFRILAWIHTFLLFLNVLPIPPLDGFQILCLGVETAAGRPLPRKGLTLVHRVAFVVLGLWLALNAWLVLRDATVAVF